MAPRVLSLELVLRCPACGKMAFRQDPELYRGAMTCESKKCDCHWWAFRLKPGSIRGQLLEAFDDLMFVAELMDSFGLPDTIARPMFWQIQLTGSEWYRYNNDRELPSPSTALLRGVVRRAS